MYLFVYVFIYLAAPTNIPPAKLKHLQFEILSEMNMELCIVLILMNECEVLRYTEG